MFFNESLGVPQERQRLRMNARRQVQVSLPSTVEAFLQAREADSVLEAGFGSLTSECALEPNASVIAP